MPANRPDDDHDDHESRIPPPLRKAMRQADPPGTASPEQLRELNERVLAHARDRQPSLVATPASTPALASPRRSAQWRWASSVAAGVAFAGLLSALWLSPQPAMAGDLDGNGRINVADSYRLALLIEQDAPIPAVGDFNRDGQANLADVRGIQDHAARLPATPEAKAKDASDRTEAEPLPDDLQFLAVPVVIHSPRSVAAWQIRIEAPDVAREDLRLVGVEGGQPPYRDPPIYDPRALQQQRIVLVGQISPAAAEAAQAASDGQPTRVASLHLLIRPEVLPRLRVTLQTVADADAQPIPAAEAALQPRTDSNTTSPAPTDGENP